ncbi:type 4a pilus biogenesis protein PilO [Patescibacteria group bacterium]|nr:type 4a pilus biogenesis protein PilO [Patescibacteria group bacterium]MBU2472809.1 type 4a pilus biogenesis protein PilO [Patescibacteria group bacterium]
MNQKIIISLISLLIGVVLIFVFANSLWSSVKNLKKDISQSEDYLAKLEELLLKTEELNQSYQEIGKEADKLFLALPNEKDIPFLLVQFESLASSNGLLLDSISFEEIEKKKTTSEETVQDSDKLFYFTANVKVNGSYDAFKNYLKALENSVRAIDVYSINFTPFTSKSDPSATLNVFEFNVKAKVYYIK